MRILFQGDSITDGNRYKEEASRGDGNHQIGHSYAFTVTGKMMAEHPEAGLKFYNRGISGNTVFDLAKQWEAGAVLMNPDLLSVLVGVNDLLAYERADEKTREGFFERFEKTYREILDQSREENPKLKIVIMEPFRVIAKDEDEKTFAWRMDKLAKLQAVVRRIAEDYGAVFVPLQTVFDGLCKKREPSYWIWDGVHPTEAGHYVMAMEWIKAAEGILI